MGVVTSNETMGQVTGWGMRTLNWVNDMAHRPGFEYVINWVYWALHLLITTSFYLPVYLVITVYDIITGYPCIWVKEEPDGKAVLITGCDTGFGLELALALSTKGWKVYAGCLSEESAAVLQTKGGPNLIALKLDVTKAQDIEAAVARVDTENPQGLYALVNNAGVGRGGCIDWIPVQDYRFHMEVNFFAVVEVTKAFLPSLKRYQLSHGGTKGPTHARVVIVASLASLFPGLPIMSAYCASKHAVESFASSLRHEMAGWGIEVSAVNPAWHRTPIAADAVSSLTRTWANTSKKVKEEYGEEYHKRCVENTKAVVDNCWDPCHVTESLLLAVTQRRPRPQYLVGLDAKFKVPAATMLPARVVHSVTQSTMFQALRPAAADPTHPTGELAV